MSKSWNPGRHAVELRPSRIRREPVRLPTIAPPPSHQSELRSAVIGVVLIAVACVAVVVGIVAIAANRSAAPAPIDAAFGFCQTSGGNCVLDGQTFRLDGQVTAIAGIDAPNIHPSRCSQEGRLGISAAVQLREMLNRGRVTVVAGGRVEVSGRDVAAMMIEAGAARDATAPPRDWCEVRPVE